MTLSIGITVFFGVAIFACFIWSRQKQSHHLDDLHITSEDEQIRSSAGSKDD